MSPKPSPTRPTPPGRLCTGQRIPEGMTREEFVSKLTPTPEEMTAADIRREITAFLLGVNIAQLPNVNPSVLQIFEKNADGVLAIIARHNAPLHAEIEKLGHIILGLGQEKVAFLTENEALKKERDRLQQENDDHAESWALCGIPHDGLLTKLLVLQHENQQLKKKVRDLTERCLEQSAVQAELATLRKQVKAGEVLEHRVKQALFCFEEGTLPVAAEYPLTVKNLRTAIAKWQEAKP